MRNSVYLETKVIEPARPAVVEEVVVIRTDRETACVLRGLLGHCASGPQSDIYEALKRVLGSSLPYDKYYTNWQVSGVPIYRG